MYSYDADERRVRSYASTSGNMKYIYSGLNVVYEAPDGGGAATLRFYAGGQQVAKKTGSWVTYLHQDHLGSTRLETDGSSVIPFRGNYQPYGVDSGTSGSEEFRYTGKPSDGATGLYYFGARYYDPAIGRFITEDPHPGSISDPQSLNRYVYCRNNPHKYTDPDGRMPFLVAIAAGGVFGALLNTGWYIAGQMMSGGTIDTTELTCRAIGGFITGATTVATIPLGLIGKSLGQGAAEGLTTIVESSIKGKDIDWNDVAGASLKGIALGVVTEVASSQVLKIPEPRGMTSILQANQGFAPHTASAWIGGIISPESHKNAARLLDTISLDITVEAILQVVSSTWDAIERRRGA